jgi:uncharacterized protein (DUF736 family)
MIGKQQTKAARLKIGHFASDPFTGTLVTVDIEIQITIVYTNNPSRTAGRVN